MIAIARSFGLKTVNVVRREEPIVELKAIGGDVVLLDGPDLAKRVAAETGGAPIALAIDGVSDTATANLLACLAAQGRAGVLQRHQRQAVCLPAPALHLPRRRDPRILARQLVQRGYAREGRGDV